MATHIPWNSLAESWTWLRITIVLLTMNFSPSTSQCGTNRRQPFHHQHWPSTTCTLLRQDPRCVVSKKERSPLGHNGIRLTILRFPGKNPVATWEWRSTRWRSVLTMNCWLTHKGNRMAITNPNAVMLPIIKRRTPSLRMLAWAAHAPSSWWPFEDSPSRWSMASPTLWVSNPQIDKAWVGLAWHQQQHQTFS